MTIENQCCNLQQAKRLKELGVAQEAVFYWHPSIGYPVLGGRLVTKTGYQYSKIPIKDDKQTAALFTDAELGVMLPPGCISLYNDHHGFWLCEWPEVWNEDHEPNATPYAVPGWKLTAIIDDEETEAQCRAAMLIHLIENKLITVQEINTRLMAE